MSIHRTVKRRLFKCHLMSGKKIIAQLKKYEQSLQLNSDLSASFEEVEKMKNGKIKKQSLNDFLNEL